MNDTQTFPDCPALAAYKKIFTGSVNPAGYLGFKRGYDACAEELKAKVAEGEADRERLDWLEANLTRLHELDRDEVTYRMEYFTDKQEHLATTCSTIRRCIDAARTQEATQ